MEFFLNFKPLVKNSFCQTLLGACVDFERDFKSKTHLVALPDHDQIALEVSRPEGWKQEDYTVLMLHGLCGSHKSHYLKRLGKRFYQMGMQVVRMNFRGCGSGRGLAKNIYHSGCSPDVAHVLKHLKHHFPKSKIILMGFSLGANVVLKLAGELKDEGPEYLDKVVAISPPADLLASARLFLKPQNQVYANYFLKILLNNVRYLHNKFPDLPKPHLPTGMNINDFDEFYVAPRARFTSALEYYQMCSSKHYVSDIRVPTKVLFAKDDPLIASSSLDQMVLPDNVHVYKTQFGGHIGYMGKNIFREFRWMDNLITSWVQEHLKDQDYELITERKYS